MSTPLSQSTPYSFTKFSSLVIYRVNHESGSGETKVSGTRTEGTMWWRQVNGVYMPRRSVIVRKPIIPTVLVFLSKSERSERGLLFCKLIC